MFVFLWSRLVFEPMPSYCNRSSSVISGLFRRILIEFRSVLMTCLVSNLRARTIETSIDVFNEVSIVCRLSPFLNPVLIRSLICRVSRLSSTMSSEFSVRPFQGRVFFVACLWLNLIFSVWVVCARIFICPISSGIRSKFFRIGRIFCFACVWRVNGVGALSFAGLMGFGRLLGRKSWFVGFFFWDLNLKVLEGRFCVIRPMIYCWI